MPSRKVEDLVPELQKLYNKFHSAMVRAGLDFIVTCTYRSQEEQNILYAQGRTTKGPKVTWTLQSKHTDRKAFDIAILLMGKITWSLEYYDQAGSIGESVGLKWGGSFTNKDRSHFELQGEYRT